MFQLDIRNDGAVSTSKYWPTVEAQPIELRLDIRTAPNDE